MASEETRDIAVEDVLPNEPETVWRTLTTPKLIERWLMPTSFEAKVGKRFRFQTKPMGDWDGVVECEVLSIEPRHKLVYNWKGGSDSNPKYGSRLDTVVTWTLTPAGFGTRLRLAHSGFRAPENEFAFEAMSIGWRRVMVSIGAIAAELEYYRPHGVRRAPHPR